MALTNEQIIALVQSGNNRTQRLLDMIREQMVINNQKLDEILNVGLLINDSVEDVRDVVAAPEFMLVQKATLNNTPGLTLYYHTARNDLIQQNDGIRTLWQLDQPYNEPTNGSNWRLWVAKSADIGKKFFISGLDENGEAKDEFHTATATNTDIGRWTSIYRIAQATPGEVKNAGQVVIYDGANKPQQFIKPGEAFSYTGFYRVPSNEWVLLFSVYVARSSNKVRLYLELGNADTPQKKFMELTDGYNEIKPPFRLSPGLDIRILAESRSQNQESASVTLGMVRVDPNVVPINTK